MSNSPITITTTGALAYEFHLEGTTLSCLIYITQDSLHYQMHDKEFQTYDRLPIAEYIETGIFHSGTNRFLLHTNNQSLTVYRIPTEAFKLPGDAMLTRQQKSSSVLNIEPIKIRIEFL